MTRLKGLLYHNSRLEKRRTFPQWGTSLMGPINDRLGLEQGGVNSDRLYKLCNNDLLEAHNLKLGANIEGVVISSIGQADDVVLVANSPLNLKCILHLTFQYFARNNVTLVPEKTKLLAWSPLRLNEQTNMMKLECPLAIDNSNIHYSESAEHVDYHTNN